jgi:hypothetical protein
MVQHCYTLWESRNKDKHGNDTETKRAVLLAQVQWQMAVMYELKHRCFPSDRLKWFHSTLDEHTTKKPHLYQQQAWLETYEPMIRRTIHDRDRVIQQRLHIIDEYFPPLPVESKTDQETSELISQSEQSIVVAWFLWNWAGDALLELTA